MDVLFDGFRLNVRLNKRIYRGVLQIAERERYSDYMQDVGIMSLPPTKRVARQLIDMGLRFDDSARIFVDRLSKGPDFGALLPLKPYPYQKEGILYLLNHSNNLLLGDEMGLGKTIQIAGYLFFSQTFPTLIICPSSLKLNWEREISIWTRKKCLVLSGLSSYSIMEFLDDYPIIIINYDILGRKDKDEVKAEDERIKRAKALKYPYRKKKIHPIGWVDILKEIPFKNIVCDESQFIGGESTARTQAVIDICRGVPEARRLFLSGTPYTAATEQFFTTLYLIAPDIFSNRWRFKMDFCSPVKTRFGWLFRGLSNGKKLHSLVAGLMLRRLKKDVLKDLPDKIKSPVIMEVDSRLYDKYLVDEKYLLNGAIKDKEKTYQQLKVMAYRAKYKSCLLWINEYLECNNKLVVFVYHREAFAQVMADYKKIAVGINGETPSGERLKIVDKFQKDAKVRLFVGQIKAAGVGITLTAASAVAFLEFGDTAADHEQAEDRIHRIGQEAESVTAYYLVAPETIDDDIVDRIKQGYANQKKVLDGQDNAEFISDSPTDFRDQVLMARQGRLGRG